MDLSSSGGTLSSGLLGAAAAVEDEALKPEAGAAAEVVPDAGTALEVARLNTNAPSAVVVACPPATARGGFKGVMGEAPPFGAAFSLFELALESELASAAAGAGFGAAVPAGAKSDARAGGKGLSGLKLAVCGSYTV